MKVSYQWLQEYLDLDVAPQDLAEKIARTSVDINDVYSLISTEVRAIFSAKS